MNAEKRWLVAITLIQMLMIVALIGTTFRAVSGNDPTFLSMDMRAALVPLQAVVLLASAVILWGLLRRSHARQQRAEQRLNDLSRAFAEFVDRKFAQWALTPAERDVALFSLKGFSLAEIAGLRQTSEGTIKAQSNAIYRKAGVRGRSQLMSLFIEELFDDPFAGPGNPPTG